MKRLGFGRRICKFVGDYLSDEIYDIFLAKGVVRTHLTFEEIGDSYLEGKIKAELVIRWYEEGITELEEEELDEKKYVRDGVTYH